MRRKLIAFAATVMVAAAGFTISLLLSGGGAAAPAPRITICHHTGSQTNPTVTITVSENALEAHLRHGDEIGPCAPGTSPTPTPTTTTTTAEPPLPPVTGVAGLSCRLADPQPADPLELNTVAAGDTSRTIGMEKEVLSCTKSGDEVQIRDLETFIEVVEKAGPNGLDTIAARVHTVLCVKDLVVGRVQCLRRNVDVGGALSRPLARCSEADEQPADPVQMNSKGVGDWFKTTKMEKDVLNCPDGAIGDLYTFTELLGPNPPTSAPSTTTFHGIICWKYPGDGVPPAKCNPVTTT